MEDAKQASEEEIVTARNARITEGKGTAKGVRMEELPHPFRHLPEILFRQQCS
jgi:hypothetical protein